MRSAAEQLAAKLAGPPPLGVDPTIDELLASLLAPEKHLRPRTMDEVLRALDLALLDDELPTRREIPTAPANDFLAGDNADPTVPGKPPRD